VLVAAVADKELQVGLEHVQIGEGADKIGELDHIIPDVKVLRQPRPFLDIPDKIPAARVALDGLAAIEFDGAEDDMDIVGRTGDFGGRA